MFRAALGIKHGYARVLPLNHPHQRIIQLQVGGKRKDIRPGDHHLAHGNAVEFDGAVNHLFLKFRDLAELSAGRDDEFKFVWGVDCTTTGRLCAEHPQNHPPGSPHKEEQGAGNREKRLHRGSNRQGDLLGTLQSEGLRHQLAENHMHISDQRKGDRDGNAVCVDGEVWQPMNELHSFDEAGDHRLTDPSEGQADDGDAELNAVDDLVQVLVQALHDARANPSGFNELLDASVANAHERELGGCKKRVGCHQEQDQKHPEQHKGDHGTVILTFERELQVITWCLLARSTEKIPVPTFVCSVTKIRRRIGYPFKEQLV